jgi:hypothetical protein
MEAVAFQLKLASNTIQLPNVGRFIGKDVIVTIIEVPGGEKPKTKKWQYIGSVELNGQLDDKNIRDIAYE